jgi:hypothetical protein
MDRPRLKWADRATARRPPVKTMERSPEGRQDRQRHSVGQWSEAGDDHTYPGHVQVAGVAGEGPWRLSIGAGAVVRQTVSRLTPCELSGPVAAVVLGNVGPWQA